MRARLLANLRAFFASRDVLEVETPLLSQAATTDPNIHSMQSSYVGPGAAQGLPLYLHTSPEFAMKRLLAAGSGPIYQVCKVFRQGEMGRLHNPEFTMVEWYRPGYSYHDLMDEVEQLATDLLADYLQLQNSERLTYGEAFRRYAGGIDAYNATPGELLACLRQFEIIQIPASIQQDRDALLDLLLTHIVEPKLGQQRLTFIYDYPPSQAALARIRAGSPPVAERFELYLQGMELANGFHELIESAEQLNRFEQDLVRRSQNGSPQVPIDQRFLAALEYGLPDCSGVALGFDRLCMVALGVDKIDEVLSFSLPRA
jgi:lysyl-tRNA synthetase class 2